METYLICYELSAAAPENVKGALIARLKSGFARHLNFAGTTWIVQTDTRVADLCQQLDAIAPSDAKFIVAQLSDSNWSVNEGVHLPPWLQRP
jgi:hypothetical protein